jgi:hypothetical protein
MTDVNKHGHDVYTCAVCSDKANVVFFIGHEDDPPKWACNNCALTYEKPKKR